jgi:hypothetical protein
MQNQAQYAPLSFPFDYKSLYLLEDFVGRAVRQSRDRAKKAAKVDLVKVTKLTMLIKQMEDQSAILTKVFYSNESTHRARLRLCIDTPFEVKKCTEVFAEYCDPKPCPLAWISKGPDSSDPVPFYLSELSNTPLLNTKVTRSVSVSIVEVANGKEGKVIVKYVSQKLNSAGNTFHILQPQSSGNYTGHARFKITFGKTKYTYDVLFVNK